VAGDHSPAAAPAHLVPLTGTSALAVGIPADPLLSGFVLYAQFTQFDPASPAVVPLVFSNGGMLSIY